MKRADVPPALAAELDRQALLPVTMLDDPLYRHVEGVTLRTVWFSESGNEVVLYVSIKRDHLVRNNFTWEIEQDVESGYRDVIGQSPHEYLGAEETYQWATRAIEDALNGKAAA